MALVRERGGHHGVSRTCDLCRKRRGQSCQERPAGTLPWPVRGDSLAQCPSFFKRAHGEFPEVLRVLQSLTLRCRWRTLIIQSGCTWFAVRSVFELRA